MKLSEAWLVAAELIEEHNPRFLCWMINAPKYWNEKNPNYSPWIDFNTLIPREMGELMCNTILADIYPRTTLSMFLYYIDDDPFPLDSELQEIRITYCLLRSAIAKAEGN